MTDFGPPLLLSCWHVLYGMNGFDGDDVVQPTPDGTANNIGTTKVGIITERVDCAVAGDPNRALANPIAEVIAELERHAISIGL